MDYHKIKMSDLTFTELVTGQTGKFKANETSKNCHVYYKRSVSDKKRISEKLKIKTPVIKIPFGIETDPNGKYRLTIEMNKKSRFFEFIQELENKVQEYISDCEMGISDCEMGISDCEMGISDCETEDGIEFKTGLRIGYKKGDWRYQPLLVGIKVPILKGITQTKFYNPSGEWIPTSTDIKGKKARLEIELRNIWMSENAYGILWDLCTVELIN